MANIQSHNAYTKRTAEQLLQDVEECTADIYDGDNTAYYHRANAYLLLAFDLNLSKNICQYYASLAYYDSHKALEFGVNNEKSKKLIEKLSISAGKACNEDGFTTIEDVIDHTLKVGAFLECEKYKAEIKTKPSAEAYYQRAKTFVILSDLAKKKGNEDNYIENSAMAVDNLQAALDIAPNHTNAKNLQAEFFEKIKPVGEKILAYMDSLQTPEPSTPEKSENTSSTSKNSSFTDSPRSAGSSSASQSPAKSEKPETQVVSLERAIATNHAGKFSSGSHASHAAKKGKSGGGCIVM